MEFFDQEIDIIECNVIKYRELQEDDTQNSLTALLVNGKYEQVLQTDIAKQVFGTCKQELEEASDCVPNLDDYVLFMLKNIQSFIENADQGARRQFELLCVGVSCLQLFVQNNWVGPPTSSPVQLVPKYFSQNSSESKFNELVAEVLFVDGEPVYKLANHLLYLLWAKLILRDCKDLLSQCPTAEWWRMRSSQVHQELLAERSPTLKQIVIDCIATVSRQPFMNNDKYRDCQLQFEVEASHLTYLFYEPKLAKKHLTKAQAVSKLNINLTGAMGKRTKFQEKTIAQLVLEVTRKSNKQNLADTGTQDQVQTLSQELPKDVALDDEAVLNKIQLEDNNLKILTTATEQSLILALCSKHRLEHEAIGQIVQEECMAYIAGLLEQPQCWSVMTAALFQRTYWERHSMRRAERSLTQLEELVTQFKRPTENPAQRMHLAYSVKLPPIWNVEKEQANFLMKIGAIKAALDVFLKLEMWENVITCYKSLGRLGHAETAIREQLAVKETPSLWCHLGDILENPEYYEKAWELSDYKFSRAQRCLAYYYLYKAKFAESVPYFEKALELNQLQIGVWFSYGCACMGCEKWAGAAKAFHRCVIIDYDNFEAWNNLSTAYVKLGNKSKAFTMLQEALKCEYENWKVWENYLLIGIDVGEFSEVVRCYHRLIDLKDKYVDTEVLDILVKSVNQGISDANGVSASSLRPKLLELFGRLTSKVTSNGEIWMSYSKLLLNSTEATQADKERALTYLQKGHRCRTQQVGWEKDAKACGPIAEQCCDMATMYIEVLAENDSNTTKVQMLSSAKMMLRDALIKIQKRHKDPITDELLQELQEPCNKLAIQVEKIADLLQSVKGQ